MSIVLFHDDPRPSFLSAGRDPAGISVQELAPGRALSAQLKRLGPNDAIVIAMNVSHDMRLGGADGRYSYALKELKQQGKSGQSTP